MEEEKEIPREERGITRENSRADMLEYGIAVSAGVLLVILFFIGATAPIPKLESVVTEKSATVTVSEENVFEPVTLTAKSAYVFDVNNETALYEQNSQLQLPLASITKLMTAVIAEETLPKDTIITISENALATEGDSGLLKEEKWTIRDLLDFTLLTSSNDGAQALATAVYTVQDTASVEDKRFVDLMNQKARLIGLAQTYFVNGTGLDTSEHVSGGYGSARDIAHLLSYAISEVPEAIEVTRYPERTFSSLDAIDHTASNTNDSLGNIPGLIAGKTGFTDLAGGNLAIAFGAGVGRPIVIVVLGSTEKERFIDVEKLLTATLKSLK